jgi:threonine aldolase
MIVDLRSDTVTKPTAPMRRAMSEADVGDDIYREDPVARALEERSAALLGKEAALFVPSGTMANQIALMLHCRPGDDVVIPKDAHVRLYESGGASAWAGVQFTEAGANGTFDVRALEASLHPPDYHCPRSRLVSLENTHNRAGGRVFPQADVLLVAARAKELGLALHLDGARIWNAAIATGLSPETLAAPFDTVAACFSKGLGAPVGSVIAGTKALMGEALRIRKRLGGGMRQVGILCAAALHALDHHRERLAVDHENARALATSLSAIDGFACDPARAETNIVIFDSLRVSPAELCARAKAEGVLVSPFGGSSVRAVTHLDVDRAGIARAAEVLAAASRAS